MSTQRERRALRGKLRDTSHRIRLRLPEGALARTRCVFAVFALAVTLLVVPALAFLSKADASLRLAALVGLVWTAGRHWSLYRTRRASLALVPLDGLALLAIAAGAGSASTGVFFGGVYFRSLYGTRPHVAANVLVYCGAMAAAATLGGHVAAFAPKDALNQIPGLVLIAFVMRVVADALRKEERTRLASVASATPRQSWWPLPTRRRSRPRDCPPRSRSWPRTEASASSCGAWRAPASSP